MRAALYLRLSREDDDRRNESQSIANQRLFLTHYAEEKGITVTGVYSDDGFTGTNFDRPGFQRMILDAKRGLFDTILVKDLSRLGRDHIETGYYYERYFPSQGLRFIAVNDGIDTASETGGNDMSLFKAVFNDLYAKDISQKVVAALDVKKRNGVFIGACPPYGYRRSDADPGKLEPCFPEAEVVKRIFSERLSGNTFCGIARLLDREGIPAPRSDHWNDTTVRRILTNPSYCGDLTQNRSRKISYKLPDRKTLPPEEWITVRETHPPLVSREVFSAVLQTVAARPLKETRPLDGLLFCAECGQPMYRLKRGGGYYRVCGGWKRSGGKRCSTHCCREELLEGAIVELLSDLLQRPRSLFDDPTLRFLLIRSAVDRLEFNDQDVLTVIFPSFGLKFRKKNDKFQKKGYFI